MPSFNFYNSCVPLDGPDSETGCQACGTNARSDYEQCRQSYYLKKQSELNLQQTTSDPEKVSLQILVKNQDKQITELIQNSEKDSQNINSLKNSIHNSLILNVSLGTILVILCLVLFYKKLTRHIN